MSSRKRRSASAGLLLGLGLAISVGALYTAELAARAYEIAHPTPPVDFEGGFSWTSRLFVADPQNPGMEMTNPAKAAYFRAQRFPASKPSGVCRLAVLGESSVNFLQPDLEAMRSRLRDELRPHCSDVEVINAGGNSYGSQRRGARLADVEQAIVDAEPHHVPGEKLFKDHCHLNAEGNRIWIRTVEPLSVAALVRRHLGITEGRPSSTD